MGRRRGIKGSVGLWIVLWLGLALSAPLAAQPIALHPDNPHYFVFRGRPEFLITSGEHYGAVLNLDFDAVPYLDELRARGFNLTRVFSGTYRENAGSFSIRENTLAPLPGRYLAPWKKVGSGANGVEKFDLDAWDDAYVARLRSFCAEAGRRGVVVEFVLFCPLYDDSLWAISPLNARNNVNKVGTMPRTEVFTLKHPEMVARHEAFVKHAVAAVRDVDNLYFEVCNEPYFGGVTADWQARMTEVIVAAESDLPVNRRHLIARNVANNSARVAARFPGVSVLNFHYAIPPDAVEANAALGVAIGDDETGFKGNADRPYRTEGWLFLLAGGSVYSNLDYSFTTSHEDGSAAVSADARRRRAEPAQQLSILRSFLAGLDFVRMAPDLSFVKGGLPNGAMARGLARKGEAYALYLSGGGHAELVLDLPRGRYRADWVSPLTGQTDKSQDLDHPGGAVTLASPGYPEDVALRVVRVGR